MISTRVEKEFWFLKESLNVKISYRSCHKFHNFNEDIEIIEREAWYECRDKGMESEDTATYLGEKERKEQEEWRDREGVIVCVWWVT